MNLFKEVPRSVHCKHFLFTISTNLCFFVNLFVFLELEEKVNLLMGQLDISQKQVMEAEARAEKSENDSKF